MDIAEWLRGLGLEQYENAFRGNAIDVEVLRDLTADDIKELGVTPIGHRRRLLTAIAALRGDTPQGVGETELAAVAISGEAERRQLTVMFCDLVGSTPLSTRFDPEDLREIVGAYHRCVADTVGRFAGFVAKYMGDGVLVYFGYPEAHEDDAERAVRAGLAVIDAVDRLATPEPLNVRLGVASGLVVVGDLIGAGAAQERGVVGETPNLAARLQALALPGTLVIAESTRRQIGALFEIEDLRPQPLAGFTEWQHAWRVVGESAVVSRFEALRSAATPLVGRDEEVDLLLRRWQQAEAGEGRVVLVSGEPGIGKSRLTAALSQVIQSNHYTRLRYFCSPYHQGSALYPFILQLERAAGFARDETGEELRGLLAPGSRGDDEMALLAELLSLPNSAADLNLSPQRKRERLFEALLHQLEATARNRPVLLIFEDAHWIDPTSRELLDLSLDRVARLPVLLVVTFRPEFQHAWSGPPHVTTLTLNRLGGGDGAALVEGVAGNAGLPHELVNEIVKRADGVPLFVEELTKAVLESGDRDSSVPAVLVASPLPNLAIPATLHASLIARLDRLGPLAKEVAQVGAVIGREFDYDLIEQASQRPAPELRLGLDTLAEAGLLFCRGIAPQSFYLFKHALVQDAAYGTLLRAKRQGLHARVAAVLEQDFADLVERQPELLAHHLTAAGDTERAVDQWLKAGRHATERSANQEAISHLTAGLAQLARLPETKERAKRELALQRLLGQASLATRGIASPEATHAFLRAHELCAAIGDDASIIPVLFGVWFFEVARADHANAESSANQLLERAARAESIGALIFANMAIAISTMFLGALTRAHRHFDKAIEYLGGITEAEATRLAHEYGVDPVGPSYAHAAWGFWLLGYPDQASQLGNEALASIERAGHEYTRSRGLSFISEFHAHRREWAVVQQRAADAIASAREHGLAMPMAASRIMHASARAMLEPRNEFVAEIREALAAYRATGARYHTTYYLALLAQTLAACGHYGEGLSALREAAALVEETGERYVEAEIQRLQGDLLLGQVGNSSTAEACYQRARRIARTQQAKAYELRAATSLARLWSEQGRRAEGRDLLAPVYGWFTEGFDTADLKEAKALLAELA
jgi:class 3 adenylate cyclase/predicted ATPase